MIRRTLGAVAGAIGTFLSLTAILAGLYWLTGYLPPRPVAVGLAVALAALGLAGGALLAETPAGPSLPTGTAERWAFKRDVLADLAALPVIRDRARQPRRRKAGAR